MLPIRLSEVRMISDEDLFDLPDDPMEAFLHVEEIARIKLQTLLEDENSNDNWEHETAYMNAVIGAAKVFGVDEIANKTRLASLTGNHRQAVSDFQLDIDHLRIQFRLNRAQRNRQYSVAFDAATKTKLGHLLTQVREIVGKLEVSDSKRARLFNRIALLQLEIDKDRTRMEALGGFIAEFAEAAEPAVELAMKVVRIFGEKKSAEDEARRLPAPEQPKQIEPPKKKGKKLDDEIPF